MLFTDRRVIWTYAKSRGEHVLDIYFKDVVAFLGSEGEGGFIIEADEPRYGPVAPGESTLAFFRLEDRRSAVEIVRFIEASIPAPARNLIPDVEGTGRHETYPTFESDEPDDRDDPGRSH